MSNPVHKLACPWPAGHNMLADYVVSFLKASENSQVLQELVLALTSCPPEYLAGHQVDQLLVELENRLAILEGAPF